MLHNSEVSSVIIICYTWKVLGIRRHLALFFNGNNLSKILDECRTIHNLVIVTEIYKL